MAATTRKQPLYDQLVDLLSDKIQNEMHPGDALPSERDLAETYGLSRTTVRLAMSELEELGLVTRKHGKGTFVSSVSRDTTDLMGTYSFTDQMRSLGRVPHTEVLDFEVREASKFVAQNMDLRLGEAVFRMRRLRSADGVPMMLERTYMPVKVFDGLTQHMVESKSLYEIVEQDFRMKIKTAEEAFGARAARPDEARLLKIDEDAPVLHLVRTTYNSKNVVIEYTRSVARADMFEYKIVHTRN
ncbi:GntR family transcriptional regulator [Paratractidigestivibacter sp.]|uniref:GntR family transcriptional regulator n=1 Tax=Paratractidigestivibacter sp. TaxID=2847316 RepID=UPI003AB20497